MEFKEKLKYVRGVLLISQNELAQMLEISFSTVNRLENGKSQPSFITQKKFDKFCEKNAILFEEQV